MIVGDSSLARVLADVEAHPGTTAEASAARTGLLVAHTRNVATVLRKRDLLVATDTLVVRVIDPSLWRIGAVHGSRHLYEWACDVVGTPTIYAKVHGCTAASARMRVRDLRRHGAIEPACGLWTPAQVEAAQDAAWPSVVAA